MRSAESGGCQVGRVEQGKMQGGIEMGTVLVSQMVQRPSLGVVKIRERPSWTKKEWEAGEHQQRRLRAQRSLRNN